MKNIYGLAFANCKKLETVYCLAENVPFTYTNAFQESYIEYATLFVPEASRNAYKTTAPWSQFGTFKNLEATEILTNKYATPTIKSNEDQLTVEGAEDGTQVRVYGMNGVEVGSGISHNGLATVSTNLKPGSVAIIKIGNRSVKVVVN